MTRLCVPIFAVADESLLLRLALRASEAGADLLELRLDDITDMDDPIAQASRAFLDVSPLPVILTCRANSEGGGSELSAVQRFDLLASLAIGKVAYIDFEFASATGVDLARAPVPLILSSHDFSGRPAKLGNLLLSMNSIPAAVSKIVWKARTLRDNIEAFELLTQKHKPMIALCMGEAGILSRVLSKKFAAFLTFASLESGQESAPGQVSINDMKRLYRWDAIGHATKVFGVVGSPIAHSMSPAIHNAAFEKIGYDGVYLPMRVEQSYESFKAFMESFLAFKPLHLTGLSVTIPHKENALRFLEERGGQIEELAERIGAVNTIAISLTGELRGINTDYAAILDCITTALGITRDQLKDYRVAVLGAGGTGRTAVAALAHHGATVVVYNRTRDRADALAKEFNGRSGKVVAADIEKVCDSCCQIYINTTSVGMHPNINASPLGDRVPSWDKNTLVFDTIYNPMRTKFVETAERAGAKTVGGIEMFVRQAAGQFHLWTGKEPPLVTMREVIQSRLENQS